MHRKSALSLAALAVDLTAGGDVAPTEFRLLPYGHFKAADGSGRPEGIPQGWQLDQVGAEALAASFNTRADARVIDFEHQTLHAAENGKPAPAAGWIGKLQARADGLYAVDVKWTAEAAAMIAAHQYRYISPVFSYDRSGRIKSVLHAALTNFAGLDGLTDLAALAAKFFTPKEPPMKELLKALGLAETATEAEALVALNALKTNHQGEVAALKGTKPNPAEYVDIATVTALRGELKEATGKLAAIETEKSAAEIDKIVTDALTAGKLTPATEKWARDLGKSDVAALKSYIDAAPVVVKPGATQTGGKGGDGKSRQHTDTDLAVMRAMGLSAEQFDSVKSQEA